MRFVSFYSDEPRSFSGCPVPDPPEPPECPGENNDFIEEICSYCSNYDECKKEYEEYLEREGEEL